MNESPTNASKSKSRSPSYSNTDFDSEDLNINNLSPTDSLGDYNDSFNLPNNNNNNNSNNGNNSSINGNGNHHNNHHHHHYNNSSNANSRKKKASRACFHCQKAHLTCDDSRPCQRCVKRDLASTCADGVRKKAKYLQGSYDAVPPSSTPTTPTNHLSSVTTPPSNYMSEISNMSYMDSNAILNFPLSDYVFGSETVNLEYDIITTMLQPPTLDSSILPTTNGTTGAADTSPDNTSPQSQLRDMSHYDPLWTDATVIKQNGGPTSPTTMKTEPVTSSAGFGTSPVVSSASTPGPQQTQQLLQQPTTPTSVTPTSVTGTKRDAQGKRKSTMVTPENVYANVKRPFNYAEGFHYLIKYVQDKMGKDDLMRISRALALFRPSFIALIMNLTEEDLIFMEKCFQRQLLEYEKLISFSGTPTVVWRRTGEIVLVGKEFSLLTQWGKDLLLGLGNGRKIYIYELMDSQSAVEYWEKFSTHAFDNVESSVMTTCILMSPQNRPVPCTFCFTIKRDIFDLPSVVVGNFLPILS